MKREKLLSAGWAFLFSFGLSLSTTMCMVTAFHFGIDTGLLAGICALASLVCSLCYSQPLSLAPIGCGAAILGYLWEAGLLENAAEAFLNRISRQYDQAYGWGIIRWGYRTADDMEPDIVIILCILGAAMAMLCAWSVCRRKPVFPAFALSFVTFAACFVVNDTVPDTPWLFVLLLVYILLMMTGSVRKHDGAQGNRLCLWLTPATALALLILFAAIPRDSYTGQEAAQRLTASIVQSESLQQLLGQVDEGAGITDTDSVDLRTVGYRISSHAQVLQVTAPYTGTIYLRSRAMDTYDGITWSSSGSTYAALDWPNHQLESLGELTVSTRFAHRMLYMPYYTDITEMREVTVGIENKDLVTAYSFPVRKLSNPNYFSNLYPRYDSPQNSMPQDIMDQYIFMDENVKSWAKPLAEKIVGKAENPYHKAQAISDYVRNSATYDTRTPRMPGSQKNFARWFLEESETGYCVHFATAATVMLQAAGIPARYVTGYCAQVTEGETVAVYADQAHAWAEYWLPGFGWTVLDATPADFSAAATEAVPETTVSNAETPDVTVSRNDSTMPGSTDTPQTRINGDIFLWLLIGIAAICALVTAAEGQRILRLRLHQQKLERADPNQKALLLWQDVALYAQMSQETPDPQLYQLALRAKFSQHTLTDAQLQQFSDYITAAVTRLKRHNLLRRFYYRTIRSLY